VVKQAFMHKRKTLRNNLKSLIPDDALVGLNIRPESRAETLTIEQFAQIANYLTVHSD